MQDLKERSIGEKSMNAENTEQQLHDRASLGLDLSPGEPAHLEDWYARQDQEEGELLGISSPLGSSAELQSHVDFAWRQLQTVAQRIQVLSIENETLRRENASLQHQLSEKRKAQLA
jgi:hypothetical protein